MPRQRLAVIAVDLALLLRRQLRKPHLTGVALNQCSSAPTMLSLEGREAPPPSYILTASNRRCSEMYCFTTETVNVPSQ
ncbi:hypothetical protein CgunFtcFv8_025533 [Champsocephalus gunnari]|uniref:Uncharacterized protein n=1 Tax=Champsocephalus gunnari TaxID=52237 RepID=A0AAN8CDR7_CHAGU|nr:hypothetical protein CgunFtcFv8_025533 [Champsocephalus gunnari]